MPSVWKAMSDMTRPILVECEVAGYPNRDADGLVMYENTHYEDEAAAWAHLLREREAHVSLTVSSVKRHRELLAKQEEGLIRAAILLEETRQNQLEYERVHAV